MKMTRFEPWSLFDVMQRDLDRMAGHRLRVVGHDDKDHSVADWAPAVDIICLLYTSDAADEYQRV